MADLCRHKLIVCHLCVQVEDSGKRMSDRINLMLIARTWEELSRGWMAFRIDNGDTDGILYDSRSDAIKHQLDERFCCYFAMNRALGGVNPRDCQLYINLHRHIYDAGGRLIDPDAPSDLIISSRGYSIMTEGMSPHER